MLYKKIILRDVNLNTHKNYSTEDLQKMAKQLVSAGYRTEARVGNAIIKKDFTSSLDEIVQKTPYEILCLYKQNMQFGMVSSGEKWELHFGFMRGCGKKWFS